MTNLKKLYDKFFITSSEAVQAIAINEKKVFYWRYDF